MRKILFLIITVFLITGQTACGNVAPQHESPPAAESSVAEGNLTEAETSAAEENPVKETGDEPVAVRVEGIDIPEFSFMVNETKITENDMAFYPVYSVETTSTNTYGTTTTRVYVGYAISDILEAAGITETFSTLVTLADDGYMVSVKKEIAMKPTTLAAISEDGKFFKKGLWFAPCVSDVSPDYLRDLTLVTPEK